MFDSRRSGYLDPISELSDCDSMSALSSPLLEGKGQIFKRFRILLCPCRSMPVVFELYCPKAFMYFIFQDISTIIIYLRTSHSAQASCPSVFGSERDGRHTRKDARDRGVSWRLREDCSGRKGGEFRSLSGCVICRAPPRDR